MNDQAACVVVTKARVKKGQLECVVELFEKTNPPLVKDEPDWLEAVFTVDAESNAVTVLAYWRCAESYAAFSQSAEFQKAMGQFMPHLREPPAVSVNAIEVGMTKDRIWRGKP